LEQAPSAIPAPRIIKSRTTQAAPAVDGRQYAEDLRKGLRRKFGIDSHMTRLVARIILDAAANP
jgi:hypothetical protein